MIQKYFSGGLSADQTVNKNIKWAVCNSVFRSSYLTLVSITILQVFLLTHGITETQLGLSKFLAYLCTVIGYVMYMRPAGRLPPPKIIQTYQKQLICLFVLPSAAFLLSLFSRTLASGMFFALFTAAWMISCFFTSRADIVMYRLESCMYEPDIYGKIFGILGIVSGILSVILGGAITPLLKNTAANLAYCVIFASAAVFAAGVYLTAGRYRLARDPVPSDAPSFFYLLRETFGDSRNRRVIAIHILRGFSSGVTYFLVPAGIKLFGVEVSDLGYITILSTVAGFAANVFIFCKLDKFGVVKTSALSVVLQIAALFTLVLFRNKLVFLSMFFLFNFGSLILATAMPVGVLRVIPSEKLAAVTSLRLLIFQLTDSLVSLGAGNWIMPFFNWFIIGACVLKIIKLALIKITFE